MVTPEVMVRENVWAAEPPPLSVTFTPKLMGPPADGGVPLSAPAALNDNQAGRAGVPGDQVKPVLVPPEAVSVCE